MKNFPEFQEGLGAVKEAGNRVMKLVRDMASRLANSIGPNPKPLVLALGLTFAGGALTSCNQQTTPSNHPPEADITELVESVQEGEVRIAIDDLLKAYGVEDPDGDQLQVEVIEGNASIEDGYLIVDATQDIAIKLKVSDGKGGEIVLILRLDVNHAPEVVNDVVIRSVTLPEGASSFSLDWGGIVGEMGPSDPDGDRVDVVVDRLEGATTFHHDDGTGTVTIGGVQGGIAKVVIYLKVKDSNGGETSARVEVNISWEAVDHPTTISDVTLSVVDRAVPDDPNGVYAGGQFEISGTLSDPDGLPTDANLLVDGAGISYPVTINPDGTFSATISTTGLVVGEYPLKISGQDSQGNPFTVDTGEVLRVYPWGEIVDSTIKVHDEIGDNTYREARYDEPEDGWWLDSGGTSVWFRVEGITQTMVDNGEVRILIDSVAGDAVNASFPASGLIEDPDGSVWIGLSNNSIFSGTGHDDLRIDEVVMGGIVVNRDGKSYLYSTSWSMRLGDGYQW